MLLIFHVEKLAKWQQFQQSIVPFLNRLAHNMGFHPTLQNEKWYDIKPAHVLYYLVCTETR